jgi:hypothetical protein
MSEHKPGEMDISQNVKTFEGFLDWVRWSVIVIVAIIVFMAIFIT